MTTNIKVILSKLLEAKQTNISTDQALDWLEQYGGHGSTCISISRRQFTGRGLKTPSPDYDDEHCDCGWMKVKHLLRNRT